MESMRVFEDGMDTAIKKLKEKGAKRVFVQYPEGIKLRLQGIIRRLEKEGFKVVTCLQECFGACDIRDEEAKRLGCDTILHIGHEDYGVKSGLPVVFWEYFIDTNPIPILEKPEEFGKINDYENIGLATSIQFVHAIPKVKEFLEKKGKKVFVHKSLQYDGQVLGCMLDAAEKVESSVDCFLCISAGKFYALGIMFITEKPVFCLDLERGKIMNLEELKKKTQKIIAWNKSQLDDAKEVGILISWKRGQLMTYGNMDKIFSLKKDLEEGGKRVYVFAMDEVSPEKLEGLKLDVAIISACPRIGIDDLERYRIPILNIQDVG
jgi:2-(3-amino-3-carboxypropyl)histidine synthase